MSKASIIIKTIRFPFLILTPVCIFLGTSIAIYHQASISITSLILALSGALFAHISVNTFNEYLDFNSGLDLITSRTPFSGGSGALPQHPSMHKSVLTIGVLSLLITLTIGCYFIYTFGPAIIPIGLIGILLIISYTNWINKHPLFCLFAPGLGFSLFVIGTQYVLVGDYYPTTWLLALIPFFLVNNLLLLNQYPDIKADKKVGRNHFPIAYGVRKSNIVYAMFLLATFISIVLFVIKGILPNVSIFSLVSLPLALFTLSGMIKYGDAIGQHHKYLAANVAVTLLVPFLISISLLI